MTGAVALGLIWMCLRAAFGEGEFGSHAVEGIGDGRTVRHHEVRRGKVYVLQPRRERRRSRTSRLTRPSLSTMCGRGSGEAMSVPPGGLGTFIFSLTFHAQGDVLLFESTPGREDLVQSVRGTEFERVAQKAEFLLHVGELGLASELEAGHPADLSGVVQLCLRYVRRRAELRYRIDHRFTRLEGLIEILRLERRVRDHGQRFHVRNRGAPES